MKVKANWPVDTGKKVHSAGAVFDVSPVDAKALEAAGAVEIVERKKAAEPTGAGTKAGGQGDDGQDGNEDGDEEDEDGQGGDGSGPPA
ncbi:hypothetical protein CF70_017965 [Cupriavidus sp. SK-3]|uniref:hypothetical protein n=1 Tax=Cupriavidus sp. SK-3 TaxID=1470558 RepID=UPI000445B933|nr:hypothetical protein [Cupriavidus sp. SK-3]KDP84704.1 hypothetical protein CF70_017965 [Cupriavidus sp. SK-3]